MWNVKCVEIEVVFHFPKNWGHLPFEVVVHLWKNWGRLPFAKMLRSSSNLGPTTLLYGYSVKFCSFPAISLLVRGGRPAARYIKIKAYLSPVELNWGLGELGNRTTLEIYSEFSSNFPIRTRILQYWLFATLALSKFGNLQLWRFVTLVLWKYNSCKVPKLKSWKLQSFKIPKLLFATLALCNFYTSQLRHFVPLVLWKYNSCKVASVKVPKLKRAVKFHLRHIVTLQIWHFATLALYSCVTYTKVAKGQMLQNTKVAKCQSWLSATLALCNF